MNNSKKTPLNLSSFIRSRERELEALKAFHSQSTKKRKSGEISTSKEEETPKQKMKQIKLTFLPQRSPSSDPQDSPEEDENSKKEMILEDTQQIGASQEIFCDLKKHESIGANLQKHLQFNH